MPISLFKKKEEAKGTEAGPLSVVGFTKPKRLGFFKIRAKPIFESGPGRGSGGGPGQSAPQPEQASPAAAHDAVARKGFTLFKPKEVRLPEMKPAPSAKPPEAVQAPQAEPLAAPQRRKPILFGTSWKKLPRMKPISEEKPTGAFIG